MEFSNSSFACLPKLKWPLFPQEWTSVNEYGRNGNSCRVKIMMIEERKKNTNTNTFSVCVVHFDWKCFPFISCRNEICWFALSKMNKKKLGKGQKKKAFRHFWANKNHGEHFIPKWFYAYNHWITFDDSEATPIQKSLKNIWINIFMLSFLFVIQTLMLHYTFNSTGHHSNNNSAPLTSNEISFLGQTMCNMAFINHRNYCRPLILVGKCRDPFSFCLSSTSSVVQDVDSKF